MAGMKLLHISAAIMCLLLVFVSIVHASETQAPPQAKLSQLEEDRILDDLDDSLKKPEVYQALEIKNGEVIHGQENGTEEAGAKK